MATKNWHTVVWGEYDGDLHVEEVGSLKEALKIAEEVVENAGCTPDDSIEDIVRIFKGKITLNEVKISLKTTVAADEEE